LKAFFTELMNSGGPVNSALPAIALFVNAKEGVEDTLVPRLSESVRDTNQDFDVEDQVEQSFSLAMIDIYVKK
jgi:hypothetical protein